MSVTRELPPPTQSGSLPPLEQGDRLDRKTFHSRYEAMPEHIKAELIGGVVYMPSPLRMSHARVHACVMTWLMTYSSEHPGTQTADNPTILLGEDSEPQPDAILIKLPEHGGQARLTADDYLKDAPELIVEVASSSESYDLHAKKCDYERAGVKEYLVLCLREATAHWFVLDPKANQFVEVPAGQGGLYRSREFPGLWLDAAAVFALDTKRVLEVLRMATQS